MREQNYLRALVLEYARDLRRNSSGGDDYPWEYAKATADYLEVLVGRAASDAQRTVTPEMVAAVQEAKCRSCGAFPFEACKRHPQRDCYREFSGGTRAALPSTGLPAPAPDEADFYLVPREIIDQFPEININNYDHDDACALNAWGCEVVTNANPAPSPPLTQSGDGK